MYMYFVLQSPYSLFCHSERGGESAFVLVYVVLTTQKLFEPT